MPLVTAMLGLTQRGGRRGGSGSNTGSAPRVRGTPISTMKFRLQIRFSPAGAGNARRRRVTTPGISVQPRGCGERRVELRREMRVCGSALRVRERTSERAERFKAIGSAPRVRGTHHLRQHLRVMVRFSPAGAGNAAGLYGACRGKPVQPRGCGERFDANGNVVSYGGSAPRVRGCGEREAEKCFAHEPSGSAPRVRGTPNEPVKGKRPIRFSPAGAGNARRWSARPPACPVQPRGCGERASQRSRK